MIIVQLRGGLGNQMFQYALGRRLALDRNVPLKLDLSWFSQQEERHFELDAFNILAKIASSKEVDRLRNFSNKRYLRNIFAIYQKYRNKYKRRVIKEWKERSYDSNILMGPKNCYLEGYWQSEKYFGPIAKNLREEFTSREPLPEPDQILAKEIRGNADSVSVHIRRGDYISGNMGFWVGTLDYYLRAMQYIKTQIPSTYFYFFSDDIGWVKDNFPHTGQEKFIEPRLESKSYLDMFLIMQCKHHINANSSFSWWGAWMGERETSIVIVPNRWFQDRPYPEDRVPERWLRL
jgi:hypothetical protein